jgi:hypothetical protein
MSRFPGLALLVVGLGGCSTTIVLGNPYPDGGGADAGPVPTVEVLPNPLDFGGVLAGGGNSPDAGLTLLNPGAVTAVVFFGAVTGPFSGPAGTPQVLLPNRMAPTILGASFSPTAVGPALGTLSYHVCARGDPTAPPADCHSPAQSIRLQGNGL